MMDNSTIIKINESLYKLEEKKNNLQIKESEIKRKLRKNNDYFDDLMFIGQNTLKLFIASLIVFCYITFKLDAAGYKFTIDVIARLIVPALPLFGSFLYYWYNDSKILNNRCENIDINYELKKVQEEIKENKKAIRLAYQKRMSSKDDSYVDEIMDIFEKQGVINNEITSEIESKPKIRSLNIHKTHR